MAMATPNTFKTACRVCRDRKVKCDKMLPCRNCTMAGIVCSFPPQVRTVRRPKRAGSIAKPVATTPDDQSLENRLSRLEELLGSMAGSQLGVQMQAEGQMSGQMGGQTPGQAGTVRQTSGMEDVHGEWSPCSTVPSPPDDAASDGYWRRLEQECAGHVFFKTTPSPEAMPNPEPSPSPPSPSPSPSPSPPLPLPPPSHATGFPFGHGPGGRLPLPPPLLPLAQRRECWATYVENVDPLLKILHKPTVQRLMDADDVAAGRRGTEKGQQDAPTVALVHAVCLLAVISMPADEAAGRLGCEREVMIGQCAGRLEQALMAADFLDARDLTTMQALLLYLYHLKYQEDPRLYGLRGMTIFLAARLGLNRDGRRSRREQEGQRRERGNKSGGSSSGGGSSGNRLTAELRRRLWWQLITLVDHPDDCATDYAPPSVGADTRLPLNVNDCELGGERRGERGHAGRDKAGRRDTREEGNDNNGNDNDDDDGDDDGDDDDDDEALDNRRGFTESSFCLMQYEITRLFHRIRFERVHNTGGPPPPHSHSPQRSSSGMAMAMTASAPPLDSAEERLHASRRRMESQYFQAPPLPSSSLSSSTASASASASPSPLSQFAADAIAMILTKRRVLMHIAPDIRARNAQLSPTEHDQLFLLAIHVLELSRALQTARPFARWRWLNGTYFQWSVASFVVRDLTRRCAAAAAVGGDGGGGQAAVSSSATRRAWHVIDGILDSWPAATRRSPKAAMLRGLIADAVRAREKLTPLRSWTLVPPLPLPLPPSRSYCLSRAPQPVLPPPVRQDTPPRESSSSVWPTSVNQPVGLDDFFLLPETGIADGSFALNFEMA